MNLSLIVAMGKNREIGKDKRLLWHMPEDLKHFKKVTMGHCVIMGRKTWESIGRPLPGRKNIVVTRNNDYKTEGAAVVNSLEEALELCKEDNQPFVIGGGELYAQAMTRARFMYITEVDEEAPADTYFPEFGLAEHGGDWQEIKREKQKGFDFVVYEKSKWGT